VKREPFRVVAKLRGPMMRPPHGIYLDSLLMARVASNEGRPPLDWCHTSQHDDPEIPIALSKCGRVYLASASQFRVERSERSFMNKRFPMGEAQAMGAPTLRRVLVGGGLSKGFRTPRELVHLVSDEIEWFAIGDPEAAHDILHDLTHLGPRRGVGFGDVAEWTVMLAKPWDGFPLVRDGAPLRRLPVNWPGLTGGRHVFGTLRPPYHERWREELCVAP